MILFLAYVSSLFSVYHDWPGPFMKVGPFMNHRVCSCTAWAIHEKLVVRDWAGTATLTPRYPDGSRIEVDKGDEVDKVREVQRVKADDAYLP